MVEKIVKGAETAHKHIHKKIDEIHKQAVHYGPIAFLGGLLLALLITILPIQDQTWKNGKLVFLLLIGVFVGFVNVTETETVKFLLGGIALIITFNALTQIVDFTLEMLPYVQILLKAFLFDLMTMISAAVAVVGFKTVWDVAKDV
ncbi:MAG: hypothetical protein N3E37_01170 [Candidatus Micrarchaeota archaeon]|nr:hypothetical protein [Candidatus Micrarchaeota archaeon]